MKKLLFVIAVMLILFIAGIYIFIPGTINVSKVAVLNCTEKGAERLVGRQNLWPVWWPSGTDTSTGKAAVRYNGYSYRINRKIAEDIEIVIGDEDDAISSLVNILPLGSDSASFIWKCKLDAGFNPIARIAAYNKAGQIKKNMDAITASLQQFSAKKENIYGLQIQQLKVVDTLLVTLRADFTTYPGSTEVYGLIARLKNYIAAEQAKETNPPMLHIDQMNGTQFGVMVAIPVDRVLNDKGDIIFKRMPRGNILVSNEITGGISAVNHAYESMTDYVNDYQRISPGLSFVSLITDRMRETDSAKWVSKIYYPVF